MKQSMKENVGSLTILAIQIILIGLKLLGAINWNWYWTLTPSWLVISILIGVAIAGFIKGLILVMQRKDKISRIAQLPDLIPFKAFLDAYINGEFEEQLKHFPKHKGDE